MKNTIRQSIRALLFTGTLITTSAVLAQRVEATSTVTTSEGTISEFGPQAIVIKTAAGTEPVRYISSETTNYVDENGNPVSVATVASGLPVTVYYTKVGDTLVASKIMVRRAVTAPVTVVVPVQAAATSLGIIHEFGPEQIIIQTESSPNLLRYTSSKTTMYLDENGTPVPFSTVRSGLPVTVHYTQTGNALVASKVIVRKSLVPQTPVIETKKTTTTTETK